jgi:hypothetical protein
MPLTLEDLSESVPDILLPPLDRQVAPLEIDAQQQFWGDNGYLLLPNFMPYELIDRYSAVRAKLRGPQFKYGWPDMIPYMCCPELCELACYRPLHDVMQKLLGSRVGLHLCLTRWVSTERTWHQDDYLNPNYINGWYCAAWCALDDIHPDAGPFQFVVGSHRWPFLRGNKVRDQLTPDEAKSSDWPLFAERIITDLYEKEIVKRGCKVETYIPKKGDVLLWHARLVHRGSKAKDSTLLRKAVINHYSVIEKRHDMPKCAQWKDQGFYFVL